jgi:hypothetical protein
LLDPQVTEEVFHKRREMLDVVIVFKKRAAKAGAWQIKSNDAMLSFQVRDPVLPSVKIGRRTVNEDQRMWVVSRPFVSQVYVTLSVMNLDGVGAQRVLRDWNERSGVHPSPSKPAALPKAMARAMIRHFFIPGSHFCGKSLAMVRRIQAYCLTQALICEEV